jgi:hypothetical protein
VAGVRFNQRQHGFLLPALGRVNLHFPATFFGEVLLQDGYVLELNRHVNEGGDVADGVRYLLQERGEKFGRVELALVFPEKLPPIDNMTAAQMKQVHGDQGRLGVVSEDICVVALGRGHFLLFGDFLDRVQQVVQGAGFFITRRLAGGLDAGSQLLLEIFVPAFEEQAGVAHSLGVALIGHQAFDAGTVAAIDVIFQARMGMLASQIHIAGGNLEMAMDEVHQPVGQVAREIRAVVGGTVFLQATRHVDARITHGSELDVRVSLVVAQQDVIAGLVLFDQVVFERQRFLLVINVNEIDVASFVDQRTGLDVGQTLIQEVAADPGAKVFGLADLDDCAVGILV